MFVRNLLQAGELVSLQPGEYVVTVPVGIPLTLQYSDKGLLQKIYLNHDESEWVDKTSQYYQILFKRSNVNNTISLTGSTSYVRGVLVTENLHTAINSEPDSLLDYLCEAYLKDPESFTFYAGDVCSNSRTFQGALATRQWLTVSGFKPLPGYVVPRDITEAQFMHIVKLSFPFTFPLIASYILYHNDNDVTYPKVQLKQVAVKSLKKVVDENGYILIDVTDVLGNVYQLLYSEAVAFDIRPNSIIVTDSGNKIVHCLAAASNPSNETLPTKIRCDCCGRQLIVPATGNFKCTDPQCNSVLYPRVKQLCNCLKLPIISYAEYIKFTSSVGSVFTVLDLFEHPDYKDVRVELTIAEALRSIIPRSVLPSQDHINQLCDMFSNSVQTLKYYIQNVDKMLTDFDLDAHVYSRFITWIKNIENCSDVVELFNMPNISIITSTVSFDGDPIFRGKTIYVTGAFMHGSLDDICKILRSYSADVVTTFANDVNCVLIGDGQENINGHAILSARKLHIPIMSESEFFSTYDIDSDLAENL